MTTETPPGSEPPRRVNGTRVSLRPMRAPRFFSPWRWLWVIVPMALVYPIYLAGRALLGVRNVQVSAAPLPIDEPGLPDAVFDALLEAIVRDGRVDYGVLLAQRDSLERYAATLAEFGPASTPERFTAAEQQLAYYVNAYNALTLVGVIGHWPVTSVRDVRGPFEPKAGLGFFWGLRFRLDGERVSLYELENDILRPFGDARIHAAINCASASCAPLASEAYAADRLEAQLDAAARHFASEAPHVVVDHEAHEIRLSAIYGWYGEDFADHAVQLGVGSRMLDWIAHYAEPTVAAALEQGRAAGYAIVSIPYDWSLNGVAPP